MSKATIAILPGSVRPDGNGLGLSAWLNKRLETVLTSDLDFKSLLLTSSNSPLPLGPITDSLIAAGAPRSDPTPAYFSSSTRAWSTLIRSLSALIILTPQYNWSFPGELKNALDHLYFEWRGLPVLLITYGGHGGNKCYGQLEQVLGGGLHMEMVGVAEEEKVMITLPEEFIRGQERVGKGAGEEEFLKEYEDKLHGALKKLVEVAKKRMEGAKK